MNFFKKKPDVDFLAIGDTVTDAFIRLKQAEILDSMDHSTKELCVTFGDKVPFEYVKVIAGVGNSPNAAVSASRLGLKAGLVSDVGDDMYGKEIIASFEKNNVDATYVTTHPHMPSNYHYVLWYDVERTILVKHQEYPYHFPTPAKAPKWLYLSSLGHNSLPYHQEIAAYLQKHPEVNLAFQPGTYQMQFDTDALKEIYQRSTIFFCNVEEAQRILKTQEHDVKKLMTDLKTLGPKIIVVTDGIKGAYAYDGTTAWFMPIYPHDPFERTGAGDAFASTVTVALALGKPLSEALMWGPVNSMSVVQKVGAQEGLLTRAQLEDYLKKAPADYKPKEI